MTSSQHQRFSSPAPTRPPLHRRRLPPPSSSLSCAAGNAAAASPATLLRPSSLARNVTLILSAVLLNRLVPASAAFILPTLTPLGPVFFGVDRVPFRAPSQLFVSIGLGPQQQDRGGSEPSATTTTTATTAPVAGVDYVVPIHEEYRTSRRSKFDERCDAWFAQLLEASPAGCLGELSQKAKADLLAPVPLLNEVELHDRSDPDWTPYVSTKLPWTPLTPSYGLEQFGMPVPRRGAEAWRQFDVNGLVSQPYTTPMTFDTDAQHSAEEILSQIQSQLESQGAWLSDDACEGRLVYVNGQFVEALSKTSTDVHNLNSCPPRDSDLYAYLGRYTDGFTDELVAVDVPGTSEPLLSRLSGPNHKVGPPISQFAINTQQGTACFSALNTYQVPNVAVVQSSSVADQKDEDIGPRPVLVVQAFTGDAGLGGAGADDNSPRSALGNVRLLVVAGENSRLSVQQCQVDLDLARKEGHVPKLINSYTQVVAGASSNVTYGLVNLLGGVVTPHVEADDDDKDEDDSESSEAETEASSSLSSSSSPRHVEASRPQLGDTVFNAVDAHVLRDASLSCAGIQMGGCGRDRLALSVSLLQSHANANVNGFCLSGGAQRCETKTCVHHVGPETECRQVQKNLVGGRSTTSFRGRIRVEQDAQRTDAAQLSRSVLLTDKARAWSVPSLEIIADDVKCSHGTTVSDLSEEELFYLTSRGIDRITARKLLMYAFASDVCQAVEPVFRRDLERQALVRLENLVPRGTRAVRGEYQSI